jgi:hypothetical protein
MPQNVVNPGTVNVADQGDGLLSVDQPVTTGPSQNSGTQVAGGDLAPGVGTDSPDQTVTVGSPMTADRSVDGGLRSPQSPNTINTTQNTVINQTYGVGQPSNVFV